MIRFKKKRNLLLIPCKRKKMSKGETVKSEYYSVKSEVT